MEEKINRENQKCSDFPDYLFSGPKSGNSIIPDFMTIALLSEGEIVVFNLCLRRKF